MLKKTNDKIRVEQLADNVVLYCGDCREIIPTLALGKDVDVCSDPPYGLQDLVGGYGRTQLTKGPGAKNDRHIANDTNLKVVVEAFALIRKQLKNAWVAAFYSSRITPVFFKDMTMFRDTDYFGEMIWDKKTPGLGTQIRYQHENVAVWQIGKPPPLWDVMSLVTYTSLKGDQRSEGSSHPHEKPHNVMMHVVGALPEKRTILDPFMGTGSTGAAAVQSKHGFIGCELELRHFEVSLKKVNAAIKQPTAFWE